VAVPHRVDCLVRAYVVVHELVHIIESRHDMAFWQRVERAMPDYAARKEWLAKHGHQF